jgi:hypothetical protein
MELPLELLEFYSKRAVSDTFAAGSGSPSNLNSNFSQEGGVCSGDSDFSIRGSQ